MILIIILNLFSLPIEKVIFQGNRSFKTKNLMEILPFKIKEEYDEEIIIKGEERLKRFYCHNGFIFTQIKTQIDTIKKGIIVKYIIEEKERPKIREINFYGVEKKEVLNLFSLPKFYEPQKIEDIKNKLLKYFKENGCYYITVEYDTLLRNEEIIINFYINKKLLCYFKNIELKGIDNIRPKTILRLLEIKKGDRFSQKKIERSLTNLYQSNLFNKIYYLLIPDSIYPESLNLVFYFSTQKTRSLGFGFGYTFPPSRLLFSLENSYYNFLNRGQELKLIQEFSPAINLKEANFNLRLFYQVPFLGMRKINFFFSPFLIYEKKKKEKKLEIGEEVGLYYDLNKYWQISLYNRIKKIYFIEDEKITNSFIIKNVFDTRNDYFSPERGTYFSPVIEIAGGLLRGDNHFFRIYGELRNFWKIVNFLIFAQRVFLGKIIPYGKTYEIPTYEKFLLGGRYSLRGYLDKEFSLNKVFYQNLEFRFKINRLFGFLLFFDWGIVNKDIKRSCGLGIRIFTPIGPLRIDYGNKTTEIFRRFGKIYLGLGNVF
ncbi:MAG: BamA/TamA family outer membrane protein [candidate division WOR-3 bacterium]|nr:BamA/TamA family outer membrane protein [candidate division WOR-3 bacterium]MCX7837368.1 BamA/TamA family outer membrane protein [candidate division WOR-3 bacterium]MDW8114113.1 BamA/TamA family outer membrane protein [candidate division WOR-3 bacterium]